MLVIFPVALVTLTSNVFAVIIRESPNAAAQDTSTDYPLGDVSRWLPQVKSYRLRGEVCDETSPERIAANLQDVKARIPDLKNPDPNLFTGLLPVHYTLVDYAFDRKRTRSVHEDRTDKGRVLSRNVHIWGGDRSLTHDEYPPSHHNDFGFDSKPDYAMQLMFSYCTYISRQPPVFWRRNSPEAKKAFEQTSGTPANYIRVGRENYHGFDCYVFLLSDSAGNERNRYYYIGVSDGRWYGAKEGIMDMPDEAAFNRNYTRAVEEFLGKRIGQRELDSDELAQFRSLRQDKKSAWCRILYAHVAKDYVPLIEYWFSDYRKVGNGRVFPYREESLLFPVFDRKTKTASVGVKRTLIVKDIAIDGPLDDSLFQEPLTEGADVYDRVHQPPLSYKYKANFKPEEWQRVFDEAAARDNGGKLHRQRVEKLIGRPVAPLPSGEWINSKPLTWADLRGKIVVLKFWAIGCGPCYNEIGALSGHYAENERSSQQGDQNAKLIPIVFIGVHSPGSSRDEIEQVLKKRKLAAPICIDRVGKGESLWGEFFAQCAVDRLPTTVAVDEEGRIMDHGSFGDVMKKVQQHCGKLTEKKQTSTAERKQ
jgi:thiol-disulfide isomerase/thioredoxin